MDTAATRWQSLTVTMRHSSDAAAKSMDNRRASVESRAQLILDQMLVSLTASGKKGIQKFLFDGLIFGFGIKFVG